MTNCTNCANLMNKIYDLDQGKVMKNLDLYFVAYWLIFVLGFFILLVAVQ